VLSPLQVLVSTFAASQVACAVSSHSPQACICCSLLLDISTLDEDSSISEDEPPLLLDKPSLDEMPEDEESSPPPPPSPPEQEKVNAMAIARIAVNIV
jgi:hypothetical protein